MLEPGETLEGICAASQQKGLFSGGIGGDRRDRGPPPDSAAQPPRFEPDGDVIALRPADIADAKAEGAGGGWAEIGAALMDKHAVKLELKTAAGEKLKFMFMRAEGGGLMAKLGGGESQRQGVEALAAWFSRAENAP